MVIFDAKSFNPRAFKYMVKRAPNLHMHEIKKSKTLVGNFYCNNQVKGIMKKVR